MSSLFIIIVIYVIGAFVFFIALFTGEIYGKISASRDYVNFKYIFEEREMKYKNNTFNKFDNAKKNIDKGLFLHFQHIKFPLYYYSENDYVRKEINNIMVQIKEKYTISKY